MAIQNTSFAKGEAVQKLIEVIARVNNKSVADDAALQVTINEVREMFKTDEMTEDTFENIIALRNANGLEPGHMYKTEYNGATYIAIADSAGTFMQLGFINGKAALINWADMSATLLEELGSGETIIPDSILHTMSYEQFCQYGDKQPGHFYQLTDALEEDAPGGTLIIWNSSYSFGHIAFAGYNFFACHHDRPCIYDAKNRVIVKYLDGAKTIYQDVVSDYILTPEVIAGDHLVLNVQETNISVVQNISLFYNKKGFILELVSILPSVEVTIEQRSANDSPISQATHTINGHKTLIWTENGWLTSIEQTSGCTDDFIGSNTVSSVENIPVNKSTVVATLAGWSDKPLPVSFAEGLPEGREVYVIAQNASADPFTLSFTDANVETVYFAPGQRIEFSVINIAGTYYVRVGVDKEATGGTDVEEITAEEVAAMFA